MDAFFFKGISQRSIGDLQNIEAEASNMHVDASVVDHGNAMDCNTDVSLGVASDHVSHVQDAPKKTKRRWRNQWTLLHPWAYLARSMTNEEVIRCQYCEDAKKVNGYTQAGSKSFVLSALNDHATTIDHKVAVHARITKQRIGVEGKGPLEHGLVYFCACEDLPLKKYPSQCRLQRELGTPNIPASDEYGLYVNPVSGKDMLFALRDYLRKMISANIRASPFYSLLIDESTDRTMEKHIIIYALYLSDGGKGPAICSFVQLLPIENGDAEAIYNVVSFFLVESGLQIEKLIAIATDGASVMIGHKTGVVARFQALMPHIMGIHCIAHRQALVAKEGFVSHPHVFAFVDKVASKVYSWLGKSSKRHAEMWQLMHEFAIMDGKALQIHSIRWLSRGQVMERMVHIMPVVLEQWKRREKKWYSHATLFVVQFMIHLLADVLSELNKLNQDYLSNDIYGFGNGSKHLTMFMNMAKENSLTFVDAKGHAHNHVLVHKPVPKSHKKKVTHDVSALAQSDSDEDNDNDGALDLNIAFDSVMQETGCFEECVCMEKIYVQNILNTLTRRFEDISVFNALKIFSPSSYPVDANERDKKTQEWLAKVIERINIDSSVIDMRRCMNEREDFIGMLYRSTQNKGMHDAWEVSSTAACERGFSRHNYIKSISRCSLALDTLDALMLLSIDAQGIAMIDWDDAYEIWASSKNRRARPLE
ncbi:hypothetical protein KP509_09G025500 [Ceratopteris richardii]|uniref:C17orf113 probable zinc finger domain-containing protein n=1 Tax=Ceratopteris richardii TaxID=49495 RepID=A0A8T2TYY0_CERRI|nr:hypothetical protein KP509_09G025500 [Ceratopteris richardii]